MSSVAVMLLDELPTEDGLQLIRALVGEAHSNPPYKPKKHLP